MSSDRSLMDIAASVRMNSPIFGSSINMDGASPNELTITVADP